MDSDMYQDVRVGRSTIRIFKDYNLTLRLSMAIFNEMVRSQLIMGGGCNPCAPVDHNDDYAFSVQMKRVLKSRRRIPLG